MKTTSYTVKSVSAAWAKVNNIFPGDYNEDTASSERAGYNIFRSPIEHYNYICDLGNRLEVNLASGETVNIWIEEPAAEMESENQNENNNGEHIEIILTAKESGEMKLFNNYADFVAAWRFWFSSGKPYNMDEETFTQMIENLKTLHIDGAALEILLNGLYVKIIFHRWQ